MVYLLPVPRMVDAYSELLAPADQPAVAIRCPRAELLRDAQWTEINRRLVVPFPGARPCRESNQWPVV